MTMTGCRKKTIYIDIQKIFIGGKKIFIGCKLLQAVSQLLAIEWWIQKKLDTCPYVIQSEGRTKINR